MSEPIITVSGFRGIVGDSLTPEMAMRFVGAFVDGMPAGPILVSRDSRKTGAMLCDAVRSVLCAVGRDVVDAGIAATPTTGVLIRQQRTVGGIQISASHNPAEYNGLKLFSGDGRILTAEIGAQVTERYRIGSVGWVPYQEIGQVKPCADPLGEHLRLILAIVNVGKIRERRFKVLLDCNHGAGGPLGQRLLHELGCQVTVLSAEPTGEFIHPPEPTEQNLQGVCAQAQDATIDVGFCPDPDADRLAVLDETGRYIGEEFTVALCVQQVLAERPGPIVINNATSQMSEHLAKRYDVPIFRSAVGEANVVETMLTQNAVFAGEGNGGPIDPRVGYVRDSFVGMALILDAMAGRLMTVSQLVSGLPQFAICKDKMEFDRSRLAAAANELHRVFSDALLDDSNAYRFVWKDRWLLLHPSNTEPIVRIIAEAESAEAAKGLCTQAIKVLAQIDAD